MPFRNLGKFIKKKIEFVNLAKFCRMFFPVNLESQWGFS